MARPSPNADAAAVALRLAGASFSEIADALALPSEDEARVSVERDLEVRARDADPERRELLRAQTSARLERLLRSVWTKATTPGDPDHLAAVGRALAIIDRHTKLYGLDSPSEVLVHTPTSIEIDRWVTRVVGESAEVHPVEADVVVLGEIIESEVTVSDRSAS